MIDEKQVRELLEQSDDSAELVIVEGRAQVVPGADVAAGTHRGALTVISRGDLVGRLGGAEPSDADIRTLAAALNTAADELGA